jgi:hypothetical protein
MKMDWTLLGWIDGCFGDAGAHMCLLWHVHGDGLHLLRHLPDGDGDAHLGVLTRGGWYSFSCAGGAGHSVEVGAGAGRYGTSIGCAWWRIGSHKARCCCSIPGVSSSATCWTMFLPMLRTGCFRQQTWSIVVLAAQSVTHACVWDGMDHVLEGGEGHAGCL